MNAVARFQRTAIVAATVIVILLAFLTTPPSEESITRLSPEAVSPGGGAAISRGIDRLGLGGSIVRMPWLSWCAAHPGGVLAVLGPTAPLEDSSVSALVDWIDAGGTLIYVPGTSLIGLGRTDVALGDALGFTPRTAAPVRGDRDAKRIGRVTEGDAPLRERALGDAPDRWADWLRVVTVDGDVAGEPLEVWAADRLDRPAVALFARGAGRILLWADASSLRNDRLESDVSGAIFLRSVALVADGRDVWVDGYGHGLAALGDLQLALLRWSTGTRLGNVTLYLLAVGLLALVVAGVRIAPPIPEPPPRGRSPLEHVGALADAYRRAGARVRPTAQLIAAAERRLGAVDLPTRLASLRRLRPDLAPDLDRVERASEDPERGVHPDDLVELCAALDRVVTAETAPTAGQRSRPRAPRSPRA